MRAALLMLTVACGSAQPPRAPRSTPSNVAPDRRAAGIPCNAIDPSAPEAVTIIGAVVGPDGNVAHDVRVYHPPFDELGVREVDVEVDAQGKFAIPPMRASPSPMARYWITARRADGAVRSRQVDISKPGVICVELKLAAATDPTLLHVVVVDTAGAPVPGAHVALEDQPAKTDARGETSLDYDASITGSKHLRLRVNRSSGWARGHAEVDLPRSAPVTIQVEP
jgi:hypothetical protein